VTDTTGAIAVALAKAQGSFGQVKKDKKVKVTTKSGSSYEFSYAPLESILDAVREPLAENGIVIVQMLDAGDLVTMMLHESGESITGRAPLPPSPDIQGMGSAVTYLRRYAIQAMLGIAAEDDDDGNRAAGNQATDADEADESLLGRVEVTGKATKGGSTAYQGDWRETPSGHAIGFKLSRPGDKDIPQVLLVGEVGAGLFLADPGATFMGQSVTVKGRLYAVKTPGRTTFNRLVVGEAEGHYIETLDVRVPPYVTTQPPTEAPAGVENQPEPGPLEAPSLPAFDLAEVDAMVEAAQR
jgi:hypothetical protein